MTEREWKEALVKLFIRSLRDPIFRALCLTDPLAAVKEVSGIDLPAGTKLAFVDNIADFAYCYALPPVPATNAESTDEEDALVQWATLCTDVPTGAPS